MGRALRVDVGEGWYHVTSRGLDRKTIFKSDADRSRMLELLEETVERFGVGLHAFVLMPNHYHLLVATPEGNLSKAMQWLNVSYSVWFNRLHRRSGPLFQGRFKAEVLEPAEAALEVSRYIHLNPVRTRAFGLSKRGRVLEERGLGPALSKTDLRDRKHALRSYRWSSYTDYVSRSRRGWVNVRVPLEGIGGPVAGRKAWYRTYVEQALRSGLPETPWDKLEAGLVLGGSAFVQRVRKAARGNAREQKALRYLRKPGGLAFETIVKAVEDLKGEPWSAFCNRRGDWGRDAVLYLARHRGRYTLNQLAERVGLSHYMAVSVAVSRFRRRLDEEQDLRRNMERAAERLINV